MSAPGCTRRGTRAQKCAASAQTLPDVVAAASAAIESIPRVEEHLAVSVVSPASPMCDFLQKTEQIRSGGSEPEQHGKLAALLGDVMRFSNQSDQPYLLKSF